MMSPDSIVGWLAENRTWVFSGVGVVALTAIWAVLRWMLRGSGASRKQSQQSHSLKQSQKARNLSVNIQAETLSVTGISVTEARQIALDVFKANAPELAGIARDLFESRGKEFIERYLEDLSCRRPEALDSFRDPDMLYVLFIAQREYARSGRDDLQQMLVDLLVQRTTATDLERIVLNEAITVAPKLTDAQVDTLSLVLLLVHGPPMRYSFQDMDEFGVYVKRNIVPFINESLQDFATYLHLKYTGCASMDSGGVGVVMRMENAFPGCFTLGLTQEQLQNADPNGRLADLIVPCFHYPPALQFKPMDEATFRALCAGRGFTVPQIDGLLFLHSARMLDAASAAMLLARIDPRLNIAADQPIGNSLVDIQLTSVGIAIANANIRRRTNQEFDLRIWIK
jgi:hypothetical protein